MHLYAVAHILLYCSQATAVPLIRQRTDFDGNGIPDWCIADDNGETRCMVADGTWIPILPDATAHASTVPTITQSSTISGQGQWSSFATRTIGVSATSAPTSILPKGTLPPAPQFNSDNSTKWKIKYVGDIQYTGDLQSKGVLGDKCRTSQLGDKVIWNCGDMMCAPDYTSCGFAMGPAMYGTDDVMTINTTGITNINDNDFLNPWHKDPSPQHPQTEWGMDSSNVAALNDTHGIMYGFEIWRGAPDKSFIPRGNAVGLVTLGEDKPIATRIGPLLTGPDAVGLGHLAILRDGEYIYTYTEGGPSRLIVTRVPTSKVFDASSYESLVHGTNDTWDLAIPTTTDSKYGMMTANSSGAFGCAVYGSVFYNNYFNKYVIICNIFMSATNMYVSDTPFGPWSEEYALLRGWTGYGSMVHLMYSEGGSHKEIYFSQGPNAMFNVFKVSFDY